MPGGGPAGWGWLAAIRQYLMVSAIGHLLWETMQLPLYTIWYDATPRAIVFAVLHCFTGDMIIAAVALLVALAVSGAAEWPAERSLHVGATVLALGIAYVVYSEHLNTVVRQSWAYTSAMPLLPLIGIGVAPLAQWFVVPTVALLAAHRSARFGAPVKACRPNGTS